jgi:uncharacterized protein (TIGR02246 family)
MLRSIPARRAFAAFAIAAATACATTPPGGAPAPAEGSDAAAIRQVLEASAQAWNRGDMDGFLLPYLDSPQTTFMGSDVVRGKDAIRQFYQGTWWRNGTPAGVLTYRAIEVRPLGRDYALSTGHWMTSNRTTGQQSRTGIFSLTWMRTPQGWRIIHDHSS